MLWLCLYNDLCVFGICLCVSVVDEFVVLWYVGYVFFMLACLFVVCLVVWWACLW